MSDQELSPLSGEKAGDKKKLRKRERKLSELLYEAQMEQIEALERLRRAEMRMRKRMARVQSLEDSLNIVHQQLEALQAPHATVVTMITSDSNAFTAMLETPSSSIEGTLPQVEPDAAKDQEDSAVFAQMMVGETEPHYLERFADIHVLDTLPVEEETNLYEIVEEGEEDFDDEELDDEESDGADVTVSGSPVDSVVKNAREARAVAEAAEEAARIAVERAASVEEYLEQVGSVRHLMQEFERLQTEADLAVTKSRQAAEAARAAELLIDSMQEDKQQEDAVMSTVEEERAEISVEANKDDIARTEENIGKISELEIAQVEEIEEEEEDLETVTAMIIADAAAIAAAQAEAVAEGCSARTREARSFVFKADQALDAVRDAIRKQKLRGEGAEVALKAAEREATHAHAVLADAEAAEEYALNTAMNAEAEAEVAEGMAFAASSRDERDEKLRNQNTLMPSSQFRSAINFSTDLDNNPKFDDDDDDTVEVPVIRPKQG